MNKYKSILETLATNIEYAENKAHTIWSTEFDIEDYKSELQEDKEDLFPKWFHIERYDYENVPSNIKSLKSFNEWNPVTEEEKSEKAELQQKLDSWWQEKAYDIVSSWQDIFYNDEVDNLDEELNKTIIAIALIDKWDGQYLGYKIVGTNVSDILKNYGNYDQVTFFYDGEDVKASLGHHDGTNLVRYRVMKDNSKLDEFTDLVYNRKANAKTVIEYTDSLVPIMKEIYGV